MRPYFEAQAALVAGLLREGAALAHALLLAGGPGAGKRRTADALAQGLLCETPLAERRDGMACGACPGCHWFAAGNHPDFRTLELAQKDGKLAWEISIDQVRELEEFAALSAFRGGARVVLVDPAETLSVPAANALLKLLEEPGGRTWFVLVTHRPDSLPATVRSRCRRVPVPAPGTAEQQRWLVEETGVTAKDAARLVAWSGGAPLHARHLADPSNLTAYRRLLEAIASLPETGSVAVADTVATAGVEQWYPLLQRWVSDLARVSAGAPPRFFAESAPRLTQLRQHCSLAGLARASAGLQRQATLLRHPLNPRLLLEASLEMYLDAFRNRT